MDTLTHALSGALMGRVVGSDERNRVSPGECMLLGALAAALPDADVVFTYLSPLAYLYYHRGVTHSFVLLPVWALLIAWLWSRLRRDSAGFRVYLSIALLGIAIHILGDLITSFGTMIFAPLSDARIQWGTTFIIDLWFSGILVLGLAASWVFRRSRLPAAIGLAVLCGYVVFQWTQRERAVEVGKDYAREHGFPSGRVSALPRPVSPFNWMIIVAEPGRYHFAFVNLRRNEVPKVASDAGFIARLDAPYLPVSAARWQSVDRFGEGEDRALAQVAWRQDGFGFFRWFAAYPVLAEVQRGNPSQCAWFHDLRFFTPGRDQWPFRYGMCESGGAWHAYEYVDDGRHVPVTDG